MFPSAAVEDLDVMEANGLQDCQRECTEDYEGAGFVVGGSGQCYVASTDVIMNCTLSHFADRGWLIYVQNGRQHNCCK